MINEEELQQRAESGDFDSGLDSRAYQKVYRALKVEKPAAPLSMSFADDVVQRVKAKQRTRKFLEEHLIFLVSIIAIIAAGTYCIATFQFRFNMGFLTRLSPYSGVLGFGIVLIILLNLLERKFLRARSKDESHTIE